MATIALNFKEIKKDPQRVSNIKLFINNYWWEGVNYPSKIEDWKRFHQLLSMFCTRKKWKYFLPIFQKLVQILKNKYFF